MKPSSLLKSLFLVSFLAFLGCASPTDDSDDSADAQVSIEAVGWSIDNVDPDYYSSGTSRGLYFSFWVYYKGDVNSSNLKKVTMVLPGGETSWTLYDVKDGSTSTLDEPNSRIGDTRRWWYSGTEYSLPLGTMTAVIELKDGTEVKKSWTPHHPGQNTNATADFVVSEDYSGSTLIDPVTALRRPSSVEATKSASSLKVSFDLEDGLAHNGFLWLYDSNRDYIGSVDYFRNTTDGAVASWVNSGVWKPSSTNSLDVPLSALHPETGTQEQLLTSTAYVVVVVRDGAQFSTSKGYDNGYDYRSISAKTPVE